MALRFEAGFGQMLGFTVVQDTLDTCAELFDVLNEEESVGNKFVSRF